MAVSNAANAILRFPVCSKIAGVGMMAITLNVLYIIAVIAATCALLRVTT